MKIVKIAIVLLLTSISSAHAAAVSKDLIAQGAIHIGGNSELSDYYGSGNDDSFAEYGIANFAFNASDFGGQVASVNSVVLQLTHNDRFFSDGSEVEFFFTADSKAALNDYADLSFDDTLINGIVSSQYAFAPVSLGKFAYSAKAGGETENFNLDFSANQSTWVELINSGSDFHILIAATASDADITFSGLDNTFDPGNPNLTIDATVVPVPAAFPLFLSALALVSVTRNRTK